MPTEFPWRCESGNCRSTRMTAHENVYDPETPKPTEPEFVLPRDALKPEEQSFRHYTDTPPFLRKVEEMADNAESIYSQTIQHGEWSRLRHRQALLAVWSSGRGQGFEDAKRHIEPEEDAEYEWGVRWPLSEEAHGPGVTQIQENIPEALAREYVEEPDSNGILVRRPKVPWEEVR